MRHTTARSTLPPWRERLGKLQSFCQQGLDLATQLKDTIAARVRRIDEERDFEAEQGYAVPSLEYEIFERSLNV
jgi:hypothetical protein